MVTGEYAILLMMPPDDGSHGFSLQVPSRAMHGSTLRKSVTVSRGKLFSNSATKSVLSNSVISQSIRYAYDRDAGGELGVLVGPLAAPHLEGAIH